jgi:hypothetical protein
MNLRNLRLPFICGALVMSSLGAAPANAEDTVCKVVFAAMTKLATTPSHTFLTTIRGAQKSGGRLSESINTGASRYIQVNGKWMASPLTTKEMLAQEEENRRNSKELHCSYLRDEVIAGESTAVYVSHSKSEFAVSDARVWISKRTGLPLKQEIDLSSDGQQSATHYASRYVYDGIRAPDGVKP